MALEHMNNRYFLQLSYFGKSFSGWQRQENAVTVQGALEEALKIALGKSVQVVGCGRTDTGVHAAAFIAHFDFHELDVSKLKYQLNGILGSDIAIRKVFQVQSGLHARFSAERRAYTYQVVGEKPVFYKDLMWYLPYFDRVDWSKVQDFARLLERFDQFKPFCKTNSGVDNYRCERLKCSWDIHVSDKHAIFEIESNRFLRGMVRLIVGTSMLIGSGKLALDSVIRSLETQSPLEKTFSAPAEGLFLSRIKYPDFETDSKKVHLPNSF